MRSAENDGGGPPAGVLPGGILYVVATPIGNLEDITYRAVRILGEVDVVAAEDTRRSGQLLRHLGIEPRRMVSFFEGNEAARSEELAGELAGGARVALITDAGTPAISDPGQRLVARARELGVRVEVVPGPAAAIAALVASGLPSDRFLFVGFPPRKAGARREMFARLRREPATLILYEAPDRVAETLADLGAALGADRPAAVARELTKLHEEVVRASLGELAAEFAAAPRRGEHTLVVAGLDEASVGQTPDIDLEAAVRELLAEGLGPRDVAARLAAQTGVARRRIYQLALSLARPGRPRGPGGTDAGDAE
jgi:16S rRNA (cytidine1402-2'-O)-methyltransferase